MESNATKHTITRKDNNHYYSCPILRNTDPFRAIFGPFIDKASAKVKESYHVSDVGILKVFEVCFALKRRAEGNKVFTIYEVGREVRLSSGRYNERLWRLFWNNLENQSLIEKIRRRGRGWVYRITSEGRACFLALFAVKNDSREERDDECLF